MCAKIIKQVSNMPLSQTPGVVSSFSSGWSIRVFTVFMAAVYRQSCRHAWVASMVLPPPSVLAPFYGVTFLAYFRSSSSSGAIASGTTLIDVGYPAAPPFNTGVFIWHHTIFEVSWPLLLHFFLGCSSRRSSSMGPLCLQTKCHANS